MQVCGLQLVLACWQSACRWLSHKPAHQQDPPGPQPPSQPQSHPLATTKLHCLGAVEQPRVKTMTSWLQSDVLTFFTPPRHIYHAHRWTITSHLLPYITNFLQLSAVKLHKCTFCLTLKVKVKEGHTPKERRRGAHLPFIGRWARRWVNPFRHYCLWRMASVTPDLWLPSQPSWYSLRLPTEGWVDLVGRLHTEIVYLPEDGHPSRL